MPSQLDSRPVLDDADLADNGYSVIGAALEQSVTELVPINSVQPADSPRLSGVSVEHARVLQEQLSEFPAIVVNRRTMQVVDGMHRLSAAKLQGADMIRAQFVDMDQQEAFLLAVRANIEHGLPLSLADREAAAQRILRWYPLWSDRAIAGAVGLAPSTLGAIRGRSTDCSPQSNARMGRDGRIRPMSTLDGRLRASEILSDRPDTPLRDVAAEAGVSLGTAHDVRDRMRRGEDPVPERQRPQEDRDTNRCGRRGLLRRRRRGNPVPWLSIRNSLIRDPSIRYAPSGRELLRWFDAHAMASGSWRGVIEAIPPHWADAIAGVAYACGDEWYEFAGELAARGETMNGRAAPPHSRPTAQNGAA